MWGEEVMVWVCVEKLLRRLGSTWSANTVPVFEMTPGVPASVRMVTVAVPPLAMVPSKQVTVPPASEQVPAVVGGGQKGKGGGKGGLNFLFVGGAGAVFWAAGGVVRGVACWAVGRRVGGVTSAAVGAVV